MRPVPDLAIAFIKKFEGFSSKPYVDQAGKITVGYGHTAGVVTNMLVSATAGDDLLRSDLQKIIDPVINDCGILLNNNQLSALLSFTYNCGLGAFAGSTLRQKIIANAPAADILFQFSRWNKVHGVVVPGLTYRRSAEASLYFATA